MEASTASPAPSTLAISPGNADALRDRQRADLAAVRDRLERELDRLTGPEFVHGATLYDTYRGIRELAGSIADVDVVLANRTATLRAEQPARDLEHTLVLAWQASQDIGCTTAQGDELVERLRATAG